LSKIARLEDMMKQESHDKQERHDRVVESLRQKHASQMEVKANEISELSRKLSNAVEQKERNRMDKESLQKEVQKLQDQWRSFKEDTSVKYESFNKQLNQQEAMSDEKLRGVQKENERLKEEVKNLKNEQNHA
jgi:chromosome segregation ATPase